MPFTIVEGDVTLRSTGVELATADGVAVVAGARGFIGVLYDGTNTRFVRGDTSGRLFIVGPAAHGAAVAGNPLLVGGSDGTSAYRFLTDTSGRLVVIGGSADNSTNSTVKVPVLVAKANAAAPSWTEAFQVPLSVLLAGQLRTDVTSWMGATTPTVGQKAMAASIPVVIASDQSMVPPDALPGTGTITVVDTGTSTATGANGQPIITGTPTASSFQTFALSSWETASLQVSGTWTGTLQIEASMDGGTTYFPRKLHQSGQNTTLTSFTANLSGGINVTGYTHIRIRATAAMTGTATIRVTESINSHLLYLGNGLPQASTAASSNVSQNASNVTLLAANRARLGATIWNDSPNFLYLKLGTTASTTSFTVKMNNGSYYEVPYGYTGNIDGIWATAGSGSARIVELT